MKTIDVDGKTYAIPDGIEPEPGKDRYSLHPGRRTRGGTGGPNKTGFVGLRTGLNLKEFIGRLLEANEIERANKGLIPLNDAELAHVILEEFDGRPVVRPSLYRHLYNKRQLLPKTSWLSIRYLPNGLAAKRPSYKSPASGKSLVEAAKKYGIKDPRLSQWRKLGENHYPVFKSSRQTKASA